MKVIEDQKPRRDGLIEAKGTWGEATVGSLLATRLRTEVWEIVDTRIPDQIEYGHTGWFLIRERTSGKQHPVAPKLVTADCHFLLASPDEKLPRPSLPSNAEQMALLVDTLGAQLLATKDNATGEVHCPDYDGGTRPGGIAPLLVHMEVCHGMDVTTLAEAETAAHASGGDWQEVRQQIHRAHDQGHSPKYPHVGKGGFAHRHVPEDHSFL